MVTPLSAWRRIKDTVAVEVRGDRGPVGRGLERMFSLGGGRGEAGERACCHGVMTFVAENHAICLSERLFVREGL